MDETILEAEIRLNFIRDGITIVFSGEAVQFHQENDKCIIRPKHLKLVTFMQENIKEYCRNNKMEERKK